jgi:hypothetical protein
VEFGTITLVPPGYWHQRTRPKTKGTEPKPYPSLTLSRYARYGAVAPVTKLDKMVMYSVKELERFMEERTSGRQ